METIRNPNRELDEKTLNIIKSVFEEQKHIQIVNLYNKGNNVFGVYIHSIKDSISFLNTPDYTEQTIHMGLENININLFELGNVLYHIYFSGSINFIKLITTIGEIIEPSTNYNKLCELLTKNIPFNIYKAKLIDKEIDTLEKEKLEYLRDQVIKGADMIIEYAPIDQQFINAIKKKRDDLFLDDIVSDNDCVHVHNDVNDFVSLLKVIVFDKVSEKKLNDIDELYKKIRLKYK